MTRHAIYDTTLPYPRDLVGYGRNPDGPLYDNSSLRRGTYRLVFAVADYFRSRGVVLPDPPFLDRVSLDFGIAHEDQHYHVPLLVSPWSHSTYRGS
jgi:5-hydroxyisourate hydrolase